MAISDRQQQYLSAMGIQAWELRETEAANPAAIQPVQAAAIPVKVPQIIPANKPEDMADWQSLRRRVSACTACELHLSRTQTVFGVGNPQADWLFIGEAPGAEEDKQGEPFVGRAGKLLDEMLRAIGLSRQQVFIANILKCRPPNNRDPRPAEVAQCAGYLRQQIALVQPKIIIAVGRIAAQNLLQTDSRIGDLRGHRHNYQEIPVVVTYHPAYLLRSPSEKAKAWQDLCLAQTILQQQV